VKDGEWTQPYGPLPTSRSNDDDNDLC